MPSPWWRSLFKCFLKPARQNALVRDADDGNAEAQFTLGLKYSFDADLALSVHWYRKAADQNHPLAQFNLGLMYASGLGVPMDDIQAVNWIRRAAEGGDAGAQFNLGNRYHGASLRGIQMDACESRLEAYKWLQLSAAQGYRGAEQARDRLIFSMTREEVTEGNEVVSRFVPRTEAA
jgi:TPR repeat protein